MSGHYGQSGCSLGVAIKRVMLIAEAIIHIFIYLQFQELSSVNHHTLSVSRRDGFKSVQLLTKNLKWSFMLSSPAKMLQPVSVGSNRISRPSPPSLHLFSEHPPIAIKIRRTVVSRGITHGHLNISHDIDLHECLLMI